MGAEPSDERVTEVLAGARSQLPGGGEERPGQLEMARRIGGVLRDGGNLAVQAGTGTGKSLGYLVPAALADGPVVVATVTKALQDQLAGRELPLLERALGGQLTFAVLKGRSNYLCRQRASELRERGFEQSLLDDAEVPETSDRANGLGAADGSGWGDQTTPPHEPAGRRLGGSPARLAEQIGQLLAWEARTETGDRADLSFEPSSRAWSMVSVGPRECPGAFHCPSGPHCFAEAARDAAARADVVVVNTHLYGAHLASGGSVLPPHSAVIFDEAHGLEEVLTASLGAEVTPGRLRALAAMIRPLGGVDPAAGDGLVDSAERLGDVLGGRVGQGLAAPEGEGEEADAVLQVAAGRVEAALGSIRRAGGKAAAGGDAAAGDPGADEGARRQRALTAAGRLAEDLHRLVTPDATTVRWVDGTRRAPVLRASPVDVADLLRPLWEEVTGIFTSATLPPGLPQRLGLDERRCPETDVGSPFDYRSQALLYVARHLPDRRRPEALDALLEELAFVVAAAGGRTLALFTSHRVLDAATEALRHRLSVKVWRQGDLPKGKLLRAFAEDETSCLFATMGFWQGVDVPGPALSVVALDRIPFPRPDDPLMVARRERAGRAAFSTVDLPRAATLLAQGAGRLIRGAQDRGVVVVLDPRLAVASYRGVLLANVPPMRRTTDRQAVAQFLAAAVGS